MRIASSEHQIVDAVDLSVNKVDLAKKHFTSPSSALLRTLRRDSLKVAGQVNQSQWRTICNTPVLSKLENCSGGTGRLK